MKVEVRTRALSAILEKNIYMTRRTALDHIDP